MSLDVCCAPEVEAPEGFGIWIYMGINKPRGNIGGTVLINLCDRTDFLIAGHYLYRANLTLGNVNKIGFNFNKSISIFI